MSYAKMSKHTLELECHRLTKENNQLRGLCPSDETTCSASSDAEKYADPSGPQRMIGRSQERVEEQLRIALDGHPESELWGENGLIAATMRCAKMSMESLSGRLVAFDCTENTLGFRMDEMPPAAWLGQKVFLCLPNDPGVASAPPAPPAERT